tara:strand:- start:122 stop:475 length:354 start_codon:yes stop_codon:yes gene_type:complete
MPIPLALPLAGAALGLAPSALAYMHGKSKGQNDPSKGGLGGSLANAVLFGPLAGMAYGAGHRAGRDKAVDQAMDDMFGRYSDVQLRKQDLMRDPRGKQLMAMADLSSMMNPLQKYNY